MALIWVTRSEPGAAALARVLTEHGYTPWVAPVLEVAPLRPWRALVNDVAAAAGGPWLDVMPTLVVALSAHAVQAFIDAELLARAGAARFLAVGGQTAAALRRHGVCAQLPSSATSEGLLRMPALAQAGVGDSIWILAGVGGRDLLCRQLRDAQRCRVVKFELYQRRTVDVGRIDTESIGAVIASSVQGLAAVAEQWLDAGGDSGVPVIVPSARVAAAAAEMRFTRVHNAGDATAQAALAAVRHVLPQWTARK